MKLTRTDIDRARLNGIGRATLGARITRGWDKEKAITHPLYARQDKEIEELITPEQYAQAEANGITRIQLWRRIYNYQWDMERAMSEPISEIGKHERKSKYGEYAKIAEENGIPFKTFWARLNGLKWSPEKASTKPLQRRG